MKLILLILLPGLSILQELQETVSSIKASTSGINGRMLNSIYQQDKTQLENLISILNSDVFEYYNLKNQYNTDSKRKEYIESEDYKTKYSELKEKRTQLVSASYYLDFEPDYLAERSIGLIYNQGARSFSVSNDISLSLFHDEPGYIQLDQILFKCPSGLAVSKRNVNYACVDVVEETISFPVSDDSLVPKIRENRDFLRFLFVFKITGLISTQGKTYNLTSSDYSVTTELQKVVAYNSKTNEIYSVYKQ